MLHFQAHQRSVQHCKKKIEKLNKQAARKAEENARIDQELPNVQVAVSEITHIAEATGNKTLLSAN